MGISKRLSRPAPRQRFSSAHPAAALAGVEMLIGIDGIQETTKALRSFLPVLQKKIVRRAARKAAQPVLERARDRVAVDSGDLEDSLKIRALKQSRRNRNKLGVQVVTGSTTGLFSGDAFYGGFVEFGAPLHRAFGKGIAPLEADPFLRPAADESSERVRFIFRSELSLLVDQTAAQLNAGSIDETGKRIKK